MFVVGLLMHLRARYCKVAKQCIKLQDEKTASKWFAEQFGQRQQFKKPSLDDLPDDSSSEQIH